MLRLVKPEPTHKEKFMEMIKEWQVFGGPFVPYIIDYCSSKPLNNFAYDEVLKIINDYREGKVFDFDKDYFESADFYFLFADEVLVGMGEIRHNLKLLGSGTIGHIACGIRPSKRKHGYALNAVKLMIEKIKEDNISEVIVCHYVENEITPRIISKLDFKYRNSIISEVSHKEIKCYTKKL